ncbi:uncharacterized protein LOC129723544 [Wyeomyia smithii]|uniref:uncharacterized protein LOC129723544 n=1 Tax=Wyeomyia smithii TaxID=174621 RepID=UPI0024680967|nr:uncharacterized protein LOC129723544 [Wyeomyia smithii]
MDLDQIKTELDDVEQQIPRHLMQRDVTPNVSFAMDTVDLTNDEYICEFENFLRGIQDHRKQKRVLRQQKHIEDVIPLQIIHMNLVNFYQEAYVGSLFGIDFKNVMIYGRISPGVVRQENNTHIYKLDDGSGIVDVHYAHGLVRDVENLISANKCEDILKTRSPLNEEQVPEKSEDKEDLKLLLSLVKSRCQQRLEYFTLGTRCFVIGRPFLNRWDRVSVYAYSMHADHNTPGRSAEVFWKTHLALCYEQRYAPALGIDL